MNAWFKQIRWPNLVIVLLTQYAVYQFVLGAYYFDNHIAFAQSILIFLLLPLATILMMIGGYFYNDLVDIKIDLANNKTNLINSGIISEKQAYNVYILSLLSGLVLGVWLSILIHGLSILIIFLFTAPLLMIYAAVLKRMGFIGNSAVAFLSGLSVWMVIYFEPGISNLNSGESISDYGFIIAAFSVFAFVTSLIREIIKDVEDMEGDSVEGCRTLPILYGVSNVKRLLGIMLFFLISLIVYFGLSRLSDSMAQGLFMIIPFGISLFIMYNLMHSHTKKAFKQRSLEMKILMLSGLCFLPVFYLSKIL